MLRVFTRSGSGGNPLGVVTDVSGLTDVTMQKVATDLGYSETVFIDWRDGGDPAVRIFTPAVEMPFAGHPLVGAAWVLLMLGPGGADRMTCGIGEVGMRVVDDLIWVDPPMGRPSRPDRIDRPTWVAGIHREIIEMPIPYLLVEVGTPDEVATATLPPPGWGHAVMLWSWDTPGESVKARFFAAALGVPEDPATGSAAVALVESLVERGRLSGSLTVLQGDEVGYPSAIHLNWRPGTVSLGGSVVRDRVIELEI